MEKYVNYLVSWLQESVSKANASGLVVGVSGGIDSAVVAALIKKAFPNDSLGLILPCLSKQEDVDHALIVVKDLALKYDIVNLDMTFSTHSSLLDNSILLGNNNLDGCKANLKARLRMMSLYYIAQSKNYLVCGTDNACEWYTGYFTKYGDGGVDLAPLIHLLKSDVYSLAHYLGVDDRIINKPPSAGLIEGQNDEDEMLVTYQELESYMNGIVISENSSKRIEYLHKVSAHKRDGITIPTCSMADIL